MAGWRVAAAFSYNRNMLSNGLVTESRAARVRLARSLALLVDFVQIFAFPLFFAGGASPLADVLDLVTAGIMTALVGWHWAFLPTLAAEIVPVFDLFPTWTTAVYFVTRGQARATEAPEPGGDIIDITPQPPAIPAPKS